MELSLSQLSLLIELTEVELDDMKKIINSENSSEQESDDASEHSMQLLALSASLQTAYKELWNPSENDSSYEDVVDDIYQRRIK